MPTYRVTGPDGATYDVTPPEGMNPSEAEVLAQVQARVQATASPISGTFLGSGTHAPASRSGGVIAEPGLMTEPEQMIPHGPVDLISLLGAVGAGGAGLAARSAVPLLRGAASVLGGTVGGEAGGALEGAQPGMGALVGAAGSALGEGAGALWTFLRNTGPVAKANINEAQMQSLHDVIDTVNPTLGQAVTANRARISPLTKGGTTAAAIQEAALGQSGKRALGDAFEQGMLDTTLAAQGQGITSRALETAWSRLPTGLDANGQIVDDLAYQTWSTLAPSPAGTFSATQAEGLLARLGDAAFKGEAASPIARGIGGIELRQLYDQARRETLQGLQPTPAGAVMDQTRREFAGGNALMEAGRDAQAFQGLPNRVMGNMPAIQKYVSDNRAELQAKLGDDGYRALVDAIYAGGQIGTRDIPTPGSGEMLTALRQTYGRGQGGAPQIVGSLARTVLPNLGGQTTGRGFYRLNPDVQSLLDYLGLQAMDLAREQGVGIGPTYGR